MVIDSQDRITISENAKQIDVRLEEPLRVFDGTFDELKIENNKVIVIRRIGVNEDFSLYVLEKPILEELGDLILPTFSSDTYIYIKEYSNMQYYAKYIIENDYVKTFATQGELKSSIEQTQKTIELGVNQKLINYSTTEEMNSAIELKAGEINLEVGKKVDEEDFTGANFILGINNDTSSAEINADKVSLKRKTDRFNGRQHNYKK